MLVYIVCGDSLVKGVIESKWGVIEVFGDAIHAKFGTVDPCRRMEDRDGIVIVLGALLVSERPLSDRDANARLFLPRRSVVGARFVRMGLSPLANHADKINITRIAGGNVALGFFRSFFFAL